MPEQTQHWIQLAQTLPPYDRQRVLRAGWRNFQGLIREWALPVSGETLTTYVLRLGERRGETRIVWQFDRELEDADSGQLRLPGVMS